MNPAKGPVGVFDSGVGGLSVLRAMRGLIPEEPVLYLWIAQSGASARILRWYHAVLACQAGEIDRGGLQYSFSSCLAYPPGQVPRSFVRRHGAGDQTGC